MLARLARFRLLGFRKPAEAGCASKGPQLPFHGLDSSLPPPCFPFPACPLQHLERSHHHALPAAPAALASRAASHASLLRPPLRLGAPQGQQHHSHGTPCIPGRFAGRHRPAAPCCACSGARCGTCCGGCRSACQAQGQGCSRGRAGARGACAHPSGQPPEQRQRAVPGAGRICFSRTAPVSWEALCKRTALWVKPFQHTARGLQHVHVPPPAPPAAAAFRFTLSSLSLLTPHPSPMQWRREASFADLLAPSQRPAAAPPAAVARLAAAAASQLAAEMATSPRKRARKSLAPARAAHSGDEPMLDAAAAAAGGMRRQGRCAGWPLSPVSLASLCAVPAVPIARGPATCGQGPRRLLLCLAPSQSFLQPTSSSHPPLFALAASKTTASCRRWRTRTSPLSTAERDYSLSGAVCCPPAGAYCCKQRLWGFARGLKGAACVLLRCTYSAATRCCACPPHFAAGTHMSSPAQPSQPTCCTGQPTAPTKLRLVPYRMTRPPPTTVPGFATRHPTPRPAHLWSAGHTSAFSSPTHLFTSILFNPSS